jgi:hypothetical protein
MLHRRDLSPRQTNTAARFCWFIFTGGGSLVVEAAYMPVLTTMPDGREVSGIAILRGCAHALSAGCGKSAFARAVGLCSFVVDVLECHWSYKVHYPIKRFMESIALVGVCSCLTAYNARFCTVKILWLVTIRIRCANVE